MNQPEKETMGFDLQIVNLFYWTEIINKESISEMAPALLSGWESGGQEPDTIVQIRRKNIARTVCQAISTLFLTLNYPGKYLSIRFFFFIFLVKFFLSYSLHSLLFYISFRCTAQWLDNHALQSVPPNISRTHLTPYTVITISVTTFPLLYFMSQCLPIF